MHVQMASFFAACTISIPGGGFFNACLHVSTELYGPVSDPVPTPLSLLLSSIPSFLRLPLSWQFVSSELEFPVAGCATVVLGNIAKKTKVVFNDTAHTVIQLNSRCFLDVLA